MYASLRLVETGVKGLPCESSLGLASAQWMLAVTAGAGRSAALAGGLRRRGTVRFCLRGHSQQLAKRGPQLRRQGRSRPNRCGSLLHDEKRHCSATRGVDRGRAARSRLALTPSMVVLPEDACGHQTRLNMKSYALPQGPRPPAIRCGALSDNQLKRAVHQAIGHRDRYERIRTSLSV